MSTHDEALAGVVAEIWEAVPEEYRDAPGLALNVAARLVLAARREAEVARQTLLGFQAMQRMAPALKAMTDVRPTEAEKWMAEAAEQLKRLTQERDAAIRRGNVLAEGHEKLSDDLIEARRERDEAREKAKEYDTSINEALDRETLAKSQLAVALQARDEAPALRGLGSELSARSTSTLKEIARLTRERDAAIQERDRLRAELDAGDTLRRTNAERERDAAIAEVGKVSRQLGYCEVERDVALARVRDLAPYEHEVRAVHRYNSELAERIAELEADLEAATQDAMAQHDLLQKAEAAGAANARLRKAFEFWTAPGMDALGAEAREAAEQLRAALGGEVI